MDETKIGIFILLVVGLGLLKALAGLNTTPNPVSKPFLTKRETAMLIALEGALPHCRIHAQVAMGALLKAPANPLRKARDSDRNAFSQKIVDFVAQDRATGVILALIEVDDYSHNPARDRGRDAMTGHAGYGTIRIGRSVQPRLTDVRQAVASLLMPPLTAAARPLFSAAQIAYHPIYQLISLCLAGMCDFSTILMIFSFSVAGYLIRRRPHPRSCFCKQAVFQRQVGSAFLPGTGFAAQVLDLARGCGTCGITRKTALTAFLEHFRPGVAKALRQCRGEWPSRYALTPLSPTCNTMAWFYAAAWPTFASPLTPTGFTLPINSGGAARRRNRGMLTRLEG